MCAGVYLAPLLFGPIKTPDSKGKTVTPLQTFCPKLSDPKPRHGQLLIREYFLAGACDDKNGTDTGIDHSSDEAQRNFSGLFVSEQYALLYLGPHGCRVSNQRCAGHRFAQMARGQQPTETEMGTWRLRLFLAYH